MKKNLLFASLVISALSVNAQITVNTGDMPVAGQTYIIANDTNVVTYGSAGASQTWNFAAWTNDTKDTLAFVNPSSVAGYSSFPTSTIAMDNGVNGATFFKNSSTSFDILGFYADFGTGFTAVPFTPAEKFLTFPSNYLTNYTGTSNYSIKIYLGYSGLDSMKIKANINYTSNIDGWGTITTPEFAGLSSLRQIYKEISTDSTFMKPTGLPWTFQPSSSNPSKDTTISYRWWSNTKKYPVAEVQTDGNNVVTGASYLTSLQSVGVAENSVMKSEVNIFPNPASNKINITGVSSESILLIFDVNGKLVENSRLKKSNTSLNVSNYENGTYFYQIVALNGNTIGKGKFVVAK